MTEFVPAPVARLPWRMIAVLSFLACFGATVLYSAAGGSFMPWAGPHLIRFVMLLSMALVLSHFSLEFWKQISLPFYAIVFLLLLAVELMGAIGGGSQRWLNLGVMTLQPSELMKPAAVLLTAFFFDRLPIGQLRTFDALWPPVLFLALPAFFVMLQPDLGTALAILFGGVVVMFVAGLPLRLFVGAAGAVAVIAPLAYFFLLHEYQQKRVTTFLDPEADLLGSGYHITQSKIAIGSGGFFGKGFLQGTQSHLDYLPEGHTDFVFATMAEEWGMVGGLAVLAAFAMLFSWGLKVGLRARSRFGKLTAIGLTSTIFFYVFINMMMVMGLAPVVGIPLPFLSHGGSSMLTIMLCVGIIMAIDRHPGHRNGAFA